MDAELGQGARDLIARADQVSERENRGGKRVLSSIEFIGVFFGFVIIKASWLNICVALYEKLRGCSGFLYSVLPSSSTPRLTSYPRRLEVGWRASGLRISWSSSVTWTSRGLSGLF